jgi:hypothetical protein
MAKKIKIIALLLFLVCISVWCFGQGMTGNVTNKTWNVKHTLPFRGYDASNKKAFEVRLTDSTYFNTFVGVNAGAAITTGTNNTFMGYMAGKSTTTADNNTFLGIQSGYSNSTGSGNLFIGVNSGYRETGNNKLYITNQAGSSLANGIDSALIYGDFNARTLRVNAVISGYLPHGVFSADSVNVTATITPTGHYTKMLPVMVSREADYITFAGDTITIVKAGDYEVYSNMCVTTSNVNDRLRVKVFKNGVPYSPELGRFIIRSEGTGIASSHGYLWYATGCVVGDKLSFYITNLTAARNAVISDMKVVIKRMSEN